MPHFEISSDLRVDPERLLGSFDLRAVNTELMPLVRMTAPPAWRHRVIGEWPVGERLFASWILLFGLVPIDRHVFGLSEVWPERGFSEISTSITQRSWRHEREVVALENGGCRVTDRVSFEPRLPLGPLLLPVYRTVFVWRHRRLLRSYGGSPAGDAR